jgi:hypothetical protein
MFTDAMNSEFQEPRSQTAEREKKKASLDGCHLQGWITQTTRTRSSRVLPCRRLRSSWCNEPLYNYSCYCTEEHAGRGFVKIQAGQGVSSEGRHDAVVPVGRRGRRRGGRAAGVLGLGLGGASLGEAALDARPGLGVRLAGRVADGLVEAPVLALPHQPRLSLLPLARHRRRARRQRVRDHGHLRRRHL